MRRASLQAKGEAPLGPVGLFARRSSGGPQGRHGQEIMRGKRDTGGTGADGRQGRQSLRGPILDCAWWLSYVSTGAGAVATELYRPGPLGLTESQTICGRTRTPVAGTGPGQYGRASRGLSDEIRQMSDLWDVGGCTPGRRVV